MPGNAERFEQAMSQGHTAAWDQDWQRAASFYRQALEEFPDNPKALSSLGLALYEQQNFSEALQCYQKAAQLTPDDAVPMERVGELLERLGSPEKAIDAYLRCADISVKNRDINKGIEQWMRVLQIKPDHLMAHSRLALVFERLGRKPDAIKEYLVVAGIMQHAGELNKAIQAVVHAQQILPEAPEPAQALNMLKMGRLLPKPGTGRFGVSSRPGTGELGRQALPAKKAVEEPVGPDILTETRQKALSALADLLFEQTEEGEEEHAAPQGMASLISGDTGGTSGGNGQADRVRILLHVSQAVDMQSREQASLPAIEEMERAMDAGLDHPAAFFDLGYLYIQANRYESGLRFVQRAVNHPDYALGGHLLMGQTLLQMNRLREAAGELLSALKLADMSLVKPDQAEMLAQFYDPLIEAQLQQPGAESPTRLCENILQWLTRPNWRTQLKSAREQMGGTDSEILTPLVDIFTESQGSQVVEALTHIKKLARQGKPRTAIEEAYFAMEAAPTYLPLHITVGDLLLQQGFYAEAVQKFAVVARTYNIRGDVSHAVSLYRKIVDLSPMDMKLHDQLINMLVSNNRIQEAAAEYMRLADIYYSLADLPNTRKSLEEAARLGQQGDNRELRLKALRRMADIDMQSLDWRQALKVSEQIRNLAPDDSDVRTAIVDLNFRIGQSQQALAEMNAYAVYLVEKKAFEKAIAFLEKLVEAYPKQPAILRQLAEVNRLAGNIEIAVSQLDSAGERFLEVGNRAGAIEAVVTILSLNPPNMQEYQQLLAQLRGG